MSPASVFFAGTEQEVAHHAAPIEQHLSQSSVPVQVLVAPPEQVEAKAKAGDLVIFYSEHFERFRHACLQLKQRQVATLYMIDGILEWRNAWLNREDEVASPFTMRPVLAHKVACIGNSQARVLESWGNEGKTEVVGIPRLDSLRPISDAIQRDPAGPVRGLVMTAKTPAFTDTQWTAVRKSLHDLKSWIDENPIVHGRPVEWTWRLTMDLDKELGVDNQLLDLTGPDLFQSLSQSDFAISTPSTAMLEAMLCDVPVACLDYHNCPHYLPASWDIAAPTHIGPSIESMIEADQKRMLFQRNLLYDALQLKSPATERMIELIRAMLRIASESSNTGELEFPANLLTRADQVSAEFCHQRLFPAVDSFQINDLAQLQVEHAQQQREVQRLKAEIRQLKSELGEAHQIFDAIQQHPIAGPVVRIRQKMLDFIASLKKRRQNPERNPAPIDDGSIHNE